MYAGVLRGTVVLFQDSETNSRDLKDFNLQVITFPFTKRNLITERYLVDFSSTIISSCLLVVVKLLYLIIKTKKKKF